MYSPGVGVYPELADEEWLRRKHVVEGLTPRQIAEIVGCSVPGARVALINTGLYQPRRRSDFGRRLAHISRNRLLADAATVAGWKGLGFLYGVGRTVVQNHAYALECFEEAEAVFMPLPQRRAIKRQEGLPSLRMTLATQLVLRALLARRGKEAYVRQISQAIGLPSGTVTPILARLERFQILTSRIEDVDPSKAGRPRRKYYGFTPRGAQQARDLLVRAVLISEACGGRPSLEEA